MAHIGDIRIPLNLEGQRLIDLLGSEVRGLREALATLHSNHYKLQADYDKLAEKHGMVMDFIDSLPVCIEDLLPDYYDDEESE